MKHIGNRNSELLSIIGSSFALLSSQDKRRIKWMAAGQVTLSFLDLFGIALIGFVASLAITGINSRSPGGAVEGILEVLHLDMVSFQVQTAILSTAAIAVFIARTLLSITLMKRTFVFLGKCAAEIAADLLGSVLAKSLSEIGKRSSQQYIYSMTTGVELLIIRIIGLTITLLADLTLLTFVLVALIYVNPPMTLICTLVVGIMFMFLHRLTTLKSRALGATHSVLDISSRESLLDALTAFREIASKGRTSFYEKEFRESRRLISKAMAEYSFMPYLGKYIIETSIVSAAFIVAAVQLVLTDSLNAITTLSIFMAAGMRLAPAVLRIQQGVVGLNNSWGIAESTLAIIKDLDATVSHNEDVKMFSSSHMGFIPKIKVANLTFCYPRSEKNTLDNLTLEISPGESVALVGPSGSGKTTLIDLMLGLLLPSSGQVSLSGVQPYEAISRWPGAVGYVPQDIYISNASVAQNVALGFPIYEVEDTEIWQALEKAQIARFVSTLESGLSTNLGDRGVKLSGGQKQRIGIARALLTKPKVLILDEATSALDGKTEHEVSEAISSLKGEITLISVAHRISTARRADRVVYLASGRILAQGTFEEVKREIPDFQRQAELFDL